MRFRCVLTHLVILLSEGCQPALFFLVSLARRVVEAVAHARALLGSRHVRRSIGAGWISVWTPAKSPKLPLFGRERTNQKTFNDFEIMTRPSWKHSQPTGSKKNRLRLALPTSCRPPPQGVPEAAAALSPRLLGWWT